MDPITEINFVKAISDKDERALTYVLDQFGTLIKSVIKKHLGLLPNYREECFNDVLLAIWNNIEQFDSNRSTFKNWVAGIARYKSLNYVRKYMDELTIQNTDQLLDLTDDAATGMLLQQEHTENFEAMISSLNSNDRELFKRLYFHEQEIDEISRQMNLSANVIYNRLSRGKRKLRTYLTKEGK